MRKDVLSEFLGRAERVWSVLLLALVWLGFAGILALAVVVQVACEAVEVDPTTCRKTLDSQQLLRAQ